MINASTSTGVAYGTAGGVVILGLNVNEWLAVAGIISLIATYFTNLYFRVRADRRAEAAAETKNREDRDD